MREETYTTVKEVFEGENKQSRNQTQKKEEMET